MNPALLVFSPLYPPHVGGLESHAAQFNIQLSKRGYQITVFTPQTQAGGQSLEKPRPNLTIIRFPAWAIIPNYHLPAFWRPLFWQQLRKAHQTTMSKKTIVISRTRFFFTSILAGWYAHQHHLPWLHIEHGSDYVQLNNPITRALARLFDETVGRLVLTQATTVVTNSHASARFVAKLSGRRNSEVIYRGVDQKAIDDIKPTNLEQYVEAYKYGRRKASAANEASEATITYLGRLIDGKGLPDLLDALTLLKAANYSFQVIIIGDGPQGLSLQLLAKRLGLADQVTFLGQQSAATSIAILKASDIAVNPSYTEGLPTSVIEAALSRCAIVATDVGGTNEIVTPNRSALLIPPHKPQQLAQALEQLINKPKLRQRLSDNARLAVEQKFSWDNAMNAYEQILERLSRET